MTNIYVGNLSYRATEEDVRQAFGRYGQVSGVSIVSDRETGRSRGFAFVEMPDAEEAKAAIDGLNQQEIAGRQVTVNEARPREDRPRGGRGGGYGGERGGYGGDRGGYGGDRGSDRGGYGDRGSYGGDRGGYGGGDRGGYGGDRGDRRSRS